MNSNRVFFFGIMAVGAAFLLAYYIFTGAGSVDVADGTSDTEPGPYLVISLGGSVEGEVKIDLDRVNAPQHVERLMTLAEAGSYDGVVFHRVIDGFMAQSGDVEFGRLEGFIPGRAGSGGSSLPDLPAEFSKVPFVRGIVGMARTADPNSANSQFFIMFADAPHLTEEYTALGRVVEGMELVDQIRRGDQAANGAVTEPDFMASVRVEP